MLSSSTVDHLTVVSDGPAGAFNTPMATQAAALDIKEPFDKV